MQIYCNPESWKMRSLRNIILINSIKTLIKKGENVLQLHKILLNLFEAFIYTVCWKTQGKILFLPVDVKCQLCTIYQQAIQPTSRATQSALKDPSHIYRRTIAACSPERLQTCGFLVTAWGSGPRKGEKGCCAKTTTQLVAVDAAATLLCSVSTPNPHVRAPGDPQTAVKDHSKCELGSLSGTPETAMYREDRLSVEARG